MNNLVKVKKEMMLEILEAIKNTHPYEFFAFLKQNKKQIIDQYIIVPYFYQTENAVSYRTDLLPFDENIIGTIHSQPGIAKPSKTDLITFRKLGKVHFIVGYPYNINNIYAYNYEGKPIAFKLV